MAVLVATTDIFYICKRVVCTFYTQQSIIYMIIICNCLRSFVPFWRPMTLYIDRLPAQILLWRNIRLGLLKSKLCDRNILMITCINSIRINIYKRNKSAKYPKIHVFIKCYAIGKGLQIRKWTLWSLLVLSV